MAFAGCLDYSKNKSLATTEFCEQYFLTYAIGYGRLFIAEGSSGSMINILKDVGEYMAEVGGKGRRLRVRKRLGWIFVKTRLEVHTNKMWGRRFWID
jgi:hypothetical protein